VRWRSEVFSTGATRSVIRLPDGALLAAHPRPYGTGTAVIGVRSRDGGRSWSDTGVIALDPEADTDLGDGALLWTRAGSLLYTYRHNRYRGQHEKSPDYAIRIAVSRDSGNTWSPHSTVTEHQLPSRIGPSRGLWAPSLLELPDGRIQCYYDDEKTPFERGFPGHQWVTMQTWNPRAGAWQAPTVVSRANNRRDLSRDGMATAVALSNRRILCALESVQVAPPHANLVRYVLSEDGGRTWSWQRRERGVLYQPTNTTYGALSPYLTRLMDGTLACVFCTDEDQARPDRSGTPPDRLNMDVKLVTSGDGGRSWTPPDTVTDSHRTYLPGVVEIAPGQLLAVWVDFARGGTRGRWGDRPSG